MLLRPSTEFKAEFHTFLHEGGLADFLGDDVTKMFPKTAAPASVYGAFTRCHTFSA